MDTFELKKEQLKLASRIVIRDEFAKIKLIAGADTVVVDKKLLACIIVCTFPDLKIVETKTYLLTDPLPFQPGYAAYREMPALIEAYNLLENEPQLLLVKGNGILHPRKLGVASHLGLALNIPTIGISDKLPLGRVEKGKIIFNHEILGFEAKTREYSKPVYVSPGHLVSLGTSLKIVQQTLKHPHKMPEPIHLAHKLGKKSINH